MVILFIDTLSYCLHICLSCCSHTDCRPRLVQIANESLGLGSSCYPLMNRKGHNLSTCTSELFALGGNIMDIRRSHCRIKRCLSDDTQLEDLVPRKDGWAVYRIEGESQDMSEGH